MKITWEREITGVIQNPNLFVINLYVMQVIRKLVERSHTNLPEVHVGETLLTIPIRIFFWFNLMDLSEKLYC